MKFLFKDRMLKVNNELQLKLHTEKTRIIYKFAPMTYYILFPPNNNQYIRIANESAVVEFHSYILQSRLRSAPALQI